MLPPKSLLPDWMREKPGPVGNFVFIMLIFLMVFGAIYFVEVPENNTETES